MLWQIRCWAMSIKNKELFLDRAKNYFGDDYEKFIGLIDEMPRTGFFLNEKKANKEDIFKIIDFDYKESPLSKTSFYYSTNNIGKTIAYELGLIYPQGVESSLGADFLSKDNIKTVIDLCAAPGGKTINVMNKLNDNVLFVANDISYKRASILRSNLERLGLNNAIVTCLNPEKFIDKYSEKFDLVILDAPCSGEGMIRKYPEILDEYSEENINSLVLVQENLLDIAYKLLKKGGQLLYSTCTFAFEEDEKQINNFLEKYEDIKLVELDINNNHSSLKGTIKLSFLNDTEGQFISLLRKDGISIKTNYRYRKTVKNKIVEKFIRDNLDIDNYFLYCEEDKYYLSFIPLFDIDKGTLVLGVYLGDLKKNRFEPSHALYRSCLLKNKFKYAYELSDAEYDDYIFGKELKVSLNDNYYLLTYKKISCGYGKCSKNVLKNKYPKGLRRVI